MSAQLFLLFLVVAVATQLSSALITTSRSTNDIRFSRQPTIQRRSINNDHHNRYQQQPLQLVATGPTQSSTINRAAIKAISKLISTCGIGVWAGKAGLLDQNALSVLSRLIFNLFQPCLLFVNVASTLAALGSGSASGAGGAALYILPMAAAAQILVGFTVGKLMTFLVYGKNGKNSENAKQLLACTSFANSGPLPLVFTDALFRGHPNPALLQNSVAYISMYLLGWSPLFWIVAPGILSENKADARKPKWSEKMQVLTKRVFSPPVLGSILGMLVGAVPFLRNIIVSPTGLLNPLFEAMRTLGTAYLPTVLMVLAGSLGASASAGNTEAEAVPQEETKVKKLIRQAKASQPFALQVVLIYAARFLLMPSLAFGMVGAASKYFPSVSALFKKDPLLLLVLLLEACMPSAQNTTVILQLQQKKDAAGRLARVLMVLYVAGIPAMSYWLIRILQVTGLAV
jgi:predicted permease